MPAQTTARRRSNHTDANPTAARVASLRDQAKADPTGARDQAWRWFREAGDRIQTDRDAALTELADLFGTGTPAIVDGPTEGQLVGFVTNPIVDQALATITNLWLPWAGKRFDSTNHSGDNLLLGGARWPSKLLWPLYSTRAADDRRAAFDFETRIERGALDPQLDVLVIDYAPITSNPRLIIRSIRDELVEIVPGANLGKMLWRTASGDTASHHLLAYFALKAATAR